MGFTGDEVIATGQLIQPENGRWSLLDKMACGRGRNKLVTISPDEQCGCPHMGCLFQRTIHQKRQPVESMNGRSVPGQGVEEKAAHGPDIACGDTVPRHMGICQLRLRGDEIPAIQQGLPRFANVHDGRGEKDQPVRGGGVQARAGQEGNGTAHAFPHQIERLAGPVLSAPAGFFHGIGNHAVRCAPVSFNRELAKSPYIWCHDQKACFVQGRCHDFPGVPAVPETMKGQNDTTLGSRSRVEPYRGHAAIGESNLRAGRDEGSFGWMVGQALGSWRCLAATQQGSKQKYGKAREGAVLKTPEIG